jgi:hypothetical protein
MLQKNKATMYPIDRRKIAKNVYTVLKSLRKSAIVLQCSHTTVSRWLKNIERKVYHRKQTTKSQKVVEVLKMMIQNDPFISILKMKTTIKEVFNLSYKVYGKKVIMVPENHTTKTCSCCGKINNNVGSKEIFECESCKMVTGRDFNASKNIKMKGFFM